MSRIGKRPVAVPKGVEIKLSGRHIAVKGPKGQVARDLPEGVEVKAAADEINVLPPSRPKQTTALQGLTRTLIANMVQGVTDGFKKELDMEGVGYRAAVKGGSLEILVGFSHPVVFPIPAGITIEVDKNNRISVKGSDKEKVGQVAADIRAVRPPEPYKGKGIRYAGEYVKRKVGKAGSK
jgi:large subunit ribosomal protein L6